MVNQITLNADGSLNQTVTDVFGAFASVTISGGAISISSNAVQVDTESGAASDYLDTITKANVVVGNVVYMRIASAARRVIARHLTGGGNIYIPKGAQYVMTDPQILHPFVYNGAYWTPGSCCGEVVTPVEVTPGEGEDLPCVVAARIIYFIQQVIDDAAAAVALSLLNVQMALTSSIQLVNPSASASDILALANVIWATYSGEADPQAAMLDDFDDVTVFEVLEGHIYCGNIAGTIDDGVWTLDGIDALLVLIGAETGDAWTILDLLVSILGTTGFTNAVATSTLDTADIECSGALPCSYSFEWYAAASNTLEGCTAYVDVVLHITGGGMLAVDVDVDISVAGGTATGGGTDYDLISTTVTFPAGSEDGDRQSVEVDIATDALSDDGETIILGIEPESGEIGTYPTHTLTIIAGGCSKTWEQHFIFNTTNGMQGWTLAAGSLQSYGIADENQGTPFDDTLTVTRSITIPHSSVLTTLLAQWCIGGGSRHGSVTGFGNATSYPPFPIDCLLNNGFTGLSVSNATSTVTVTCGNQLGGGYLVDIYLAGTGINPFTGV